MDQTSATGTHMHARDSATPGRPLVVFRPGMTLAEIERAVILETLRQQKYNRTRTARVLAIGIRTLQRKLKEYCPANTLDI